VRIALLLAVALPAFCQSTTSDKWRLFIQETFNPLTPVAGAFNASVSQAMNSDPRYGVGGGPYAQRFGASTADIATQNFFEDFAFASAFHEDTRYIRRGEEHGFWSRFGHAVGSAVIVRRDTGGTTFNWANAAGTAASTGLSNAYYPPASQTGKAMAIHFGTSFIGAGLGNLEPEFWPDVHHWLRRRLHRNSPPS
jgi:hypothetical protein